MSHFLHKLHFRKQKFYPKKYAILAVPNLRQNNVSDKIQQNIIKIIKISLYYTIHKKKSKKSTKKHTFALNFYEVFLKSMENKNTKFQNC